MVIGCACVGYRGRRFARGRSLGVVPGDAVGVPRAPQPRRSRHAARIPANAAAAYRDAVT